MVRLPLFLIGRLGYRAAIVSPHQTPYPSGAVVNGLIERIGQWVAEEGTNKVKELSTALSAISCRHFAVVDAPDLSRLCRCASCW